MAANFRSWIEVVSDGHAGRTHVYLVVTAGEGTEFRYEIPGVSTASWYCHAPAPAQLVLIITNAVMKTRVEIKSETTQLETLLTEIAAARLRSDDDDTVKFSHTTGTAGRTYFHGAWCASFKTDGLDCDCGASTESEEGE